MYDFKGLSRVLIANRGEIACRVIRSCRENNLTSIAIYSSEDAESLHVQQADEAIHVPGVGALAYIDIQSIVAVAKEAKADVVVPGYGFLSESPEFALELEKQNIIFAGPSGLSIDTFGLKHSARSLAEKNNVPVVPGSGLITRLEEAVVVAEKIGYPIMLKSTAGGGGMGLKVCRTPGELGTSLKEVVSRGETLFKNSGVFIEKYVECGRHIEVQVFGNGQGYVRAFGERECSVQRRHQKVIEEAPSPFVEKGNLTLRQNLCNCAIQLAASINYKSAGTVEFLVDDTTGEFYFLEMNTRLQVEHGITELVYRVDLVQLMLLQAEYEARGEKGIPREILETAGTCEVDENGIAIPKGHAIECRVYAENPLKNFQPAPGILHYVEFPERCGTESTLRIDHWISTGCQVSPYFDPLLAKVMVCSPTREKAVSESISVLSSTKIQGPVQNMDYLKHILMSEQFGLGNTLTTFLASNFSYEPNLVEFVRPGSYTTIQDLPGRVEAGHGVPLSGPADQLSFQLANIIVGNHRNTEGLEISLKGPKMVFHTAAIICLAGGPFSFKVNGQTVPMFSAIQIPPGSNVTIGKATGNCLRAYLAIKGGLPDVATYLGLKSCTPTLSLGGHQGRTIADGDCLSITRLQKKISAVEIGPVLPTQCRPDLASIGEDHIWTIRTTGGPHDSPEICSQEGLNKFYSTIYSVNLNSNRGCVRLDGPGDVFSRTDGGDGGTHPSNILEYPYPSCGISVVGSVVSLFGVDGLTLSGFVCIAVPVMCDWWKAGQAKVGGKIRFQKVSMAEALALKRKQSDFLEKLEVAWKQKCEDLPVYSDDASPSSDEKTILHYREAGSKGLPFYIRQAGETTLLLDFGIDHFTLFNNGRQRALQMAIEAKWRSGHGVVRTETSTAAMCVVFDPDTLLQSDLVRELANLEDLIPSTDSLSIESTLYKLPICFDHSAIKQCIERYMHSQRPKASYLPDNTAFLMRANCIELMEQFKATIVGHKQVVTAVSFLCANTLSVNLDPRTRLKTGKYNPARTFTPKGALGSGSVGFSIYSIDSPGGYLIWGMGLPDLCWNTFARLQASGGKPWFFLNFDQIVYYEVSEDELTKLNEDLKLGRLQIESEKTSLDFHEYSHFLDSIKEEVRELDAKKAVAMLELMKEEDQLFSEWLREKEDLSTQKGSGTAQYLLDTSLVRVTCTMAANIFRINYKTGDTVTYDDTIIILEAMKMEIAVKPIGGEESDDEDDEPKKNHTSTSIFEVVSITVSEGDVVSPGTVMAFLKSV